MAASSEVLKAAIKSHLDVHFDNFTDNAANALMNDTVVLMNDTSILMGIPLSKGERNYSHRPTIDKPRFKQ